MQSNIWPVWIRITDLRSAANFGIVAKFWDCSLVRVLTYDLCTVNDIEISHRSQVDLSLCDFVSTKFPLSMIALFALL